MDWLDYDLLAVKLSALTNAPAVHDEADLKSAGHSTEQVTIALRFSSFDETQRWERFFNQVADNLKLEPFVDVSKQQGLLVYAEAFKKEAVMRELVAQSLKALFGRETYFDKTALGEEIYRVELNPSDSGMDIFNQLTEALRSCGEEGDVLGGAGIGKGWIELSAGQLLNKPAYLRSLLHQSPSLHAGLQSDPAKRSPTPVGLGDEAAALREAERIIRVAQSLSPSGDVLDEPAELSFSNGQIAAVLGIYTNCLTNEPIANKPTFRIRVKSCEQALTWKRFFDHLALNFGIKEQVASYELDEDNEVKNDVIRIEPRLFHNENIILHLITERLASLYVADVQLEYEYGKPMLAIELGPKGAEKAGSVYAHLEQAVKACGEWDLIKEIQLNHTSVRFPVDLLLNNHSFFGHVVRSGFIPNRPSREALVEGAEHGIVEAASWILGLSAVEKAKADVKQDSLPEKASVMPDSDIIHRLQKALGDQFIVRFRDDWEVYSIVPFGLQSDEFIAVNEEDRRGVNAITRRVAATIFGLAEKAGFDKSLLKQLVMQDEFSVYLDANLLHAHRDMVTLLVNNASILKLSGHINPDKPESGNVIAPSDFLAKVRYVDMLEAERLKAEQGEKRASR